MSRKIVNDHLYTEDEIEYLRNRNREDEITANFRQYGADKKPEPEATSTTSKWDEDVFLKVKELSIEDVGKQLESYGLESSCTEKELRIRLADRLQAAKNEG